MEAAKIRIIVLNWNRAGETIACLESLQRADLGGASIMLVDNGSRDGSVEAVRQRFPGLRILALPENLGFAGGNNAGIRLTLAEGLEGVLLLNNDTRVAPDFLPPLIDAMNSSPWSGAVASAVLRLDRPEMLDVAYVEVQFDRRYAVQLQGVNALPGEGFDQRREVQVVSGCSLLLKAEALTKVGLFDEAYFAYHEDVDWCIRARRASFQLFYEPFSRVLHRGSTTTSALRSAPEGGTGLSDEAQLPNAEPIPWNPVRTYLGVRNTVRLVRAYANRKSKARFALAMARELPLELSALLMERSSWLRLGKWSYRDFAQAYFIDRHASLRVRSTTRAGRLRRAAAFAILIPLDVLYSLPRDLVRAARQGRLTEYCEYLRGVRDGVLNRRLPLKRLGLR